MTDRSNAENADRLDRYLDGSMSPPESESFERAVGQDDQLRREIDLQTRIDSAVIRAFQPPEMPAALIATLRQSADVPARRNHRVRLLIGLAVAACVVWMTAVAWMSRPPKTVAQRTLVQIYLDSVQSGFEPYWKCEFSREFAETFRRRQGQAVRMAELPEGVRMAGLAYLNGISPKSTSILFRVDNQPVLVFVDRADRVARTRATDPTVGVRLFQRSAGDLVIYEVTPLDDPRVMHHLELIDALPPEGERF